MRPKIDAELDEPIRFRTIKQSFSPPARTERDAASVSLPAKTLRNCNTKLIRELRGASQ
jgi:hypothetical protein